MKNLKWISFLLINALLLPCQPIFAQRKDDQAGVTLSASVRKAAEQITGNQLRDYLYFITSEERGRDTPSPGQNAIAKFIALNLSRLGVKPAGDNGNYFQRFSIRRDKIDTDKSYAESKYRKYVVGDDYILSLGSTIGTVSGQLVYVGHGFVHKAKNIDAYKGVDVKDKIVIFSHSTGNGLPKGLQLSDLTGKRGEDWERPIEAAKKRGAKAVIRMPNVSSLSVWRSQRESLKNGRLSPEKPENQPTFILPDFTLSVHMMDDIFTGEKISFEEIFRRGIENNQAESFELGPDKRLSFTTTTVSEQFSSQNVLGVIEGSDPILKNEYVTFMAHYDAIETGADDNGSGTVALLEIAEAFMSGPRPKRSILFLWDAGEEKGLLGTRYFVQNPPVAMDKIATHFNIDMIGRSKKEGDTEPENKDLSGANEVYLVGPKTLSTELYNLLHSVNSSYLNLNYNHRFDLVDHQFFFPRGDHAPLLQKGVLVADYSTGLHVDYHEVSDVPEKIDYTKMEKIARTIFVSAWTIANAPKRPVIDKPLPEELKNRRLWQ